MEGYLYKWINIIYGWKKRYISISNGRIEISLSKEDKTKKTYIINSEIEVISKNLYEFIIRHVDGLYEINLKAISEDQKSNLIKLIILEKNLFQKKKDFQKDNSKSDENENETLTRIEGRLHFLYRKLNEFGNSTNSLFENAFNENSDERIEKLIKTYESLMIIKDSIKTEVDDILNICITKKRRISEIKEISSSEFYDIDDNINDNTADSKEENIESYEECENISNDQSLEIIKQTSHASVIKSYNYNSRTVLYTNFSLSTSLFSKLLKSIFNQKGSLPVSYNEPISMLQRCIEPFQFFSFINKSFQSDKIEDKLIYLSVFIISEYYLNINRILKPFNPLLGETFEYYDKDRKFFAFAEQVSHHPPISAFMIKNENICVYSDTKHKHKLIFIKGAVELSFTSNVNVLYTSEGLLTNHFIYNKPQLILKNLIYGYPHYDVSGVVVLKDLKNENFSSEISFLDENNGKLGEVTCQIFKNKKIIYYIKGNWTSKLSLYSADNEYMHDIWSIPDENFVKNKNYLDNYLLSSYAYDLNHLPSSLKEYLPVSDSRFRPDQREYEIGNIEIAEELKAKLEKKQRERSKQNEESKVLYNPYYFRLITDKNGMYYFPNKERDYWEDRKSKNYKNILDIFNLLD